MSPTTCRTSKGLPPEQSVPSPPCEGRALYGGMGSTEIVERYLKADFHERLNLWLGHRELRPALSRMEKTMRNP